MSMFGESELKPGQRQIEDVINQIKGTISCSAVIDGEDNCVQEIHVLAECSRPPKKIVRDIESAVKIRLGIELDHKVISVVHTKEENSSSYNRLLVDRLEVNGTRNWIVSNVYLKLGDNVYKGLSEGPDTGVNRYKLLATATIRAVEGLLNPKIMLVVEDFSWQTVAGFNVGIAVLSCVSENRVDNLVGSCLADQGKDISTVKAVLDALNRRIDVII